LRRIEHLCRTIADTLGRFSEQSRECPEVLQDRRHSCLAGNGQIGIVGEPQKWTGRERRRFVPQTKPPPLDLY
jgi:hypothetical protein